MGIKTTEPTRALPLIFKTLSYPSFSLIYEIPNLVTRVVFLFFYLVLISNTLSIINIFLSNITYIEWKILL